MRVIKDHILITELQQMSEKMFGGLVKAVVDIEQEIMAVDAELHSDQESLLLEEEGSDQKNLWGINIFPNKYGLSEFIVFDSMINLRPGYGNRTRGVDSPVVQEKIKNIVNKLIRI